MLRRTFAFGGALLVAAALVFLTPGPGQAAPPGGGSARALEVILKASGVPNQNGQVAWPWPSTCCGPMR